MYQVKLTKTALKQLPYLKAGRPCQKSQSPCGTAGSGPVPHAAALRKVDPGDLKGAYSRRLNVQHRIVYQVLEEEKARQDPQYVDALRVLNPTKTTPIQKTDGGLLFLLVSFPAWPEAA